MSRPAPWTPLPAQTSGWGTRWAWTTPGSLFLQAALLLLPSLLPVPPEEGRGQGTPGTGLVLLRCACQALPQSPHCQCLGDFPHAVVDPPSLSPLATACSSYARLPCCTHRTYRVRVLGLVAALGKVPPWAPLGPASTAAFALGSVPAESSLQPPAFSIPQPIGRRLTARSCHMTPGDTSHSPKNCLPVPGASGLSETGDRPSSLPNSANHL